MSAGCLIHPRLAATTFANGDRLIVTSIFDLSRQHYIPKKHGLLNQLGKVLVNPHRIYEAGIHHISRTFMDAYSSNECNDAYIMHISTRFNSDKHTPIFDTGHDLTRFETIVTAATTRLLNKLKFNVN
jgi:hypothetical protein